MFALAVGRDLAIAIIGTLILSAALDGLSSREQRQHPTIHSGVAIPAPNRDAANRASVPSRTNAGAVVISAERRP